MKVAPAGPLSGKRGEAVQLKTSLQLQGGYHLNSNKPEDAYLIPLRLTWDANTVETVSINFPEPKREKYAFSEKLVSVFTGDFAITTTMKPKVAGFTVLMGKLRYQACNHNACLPPKTIDIKVPADFR
ncbi:MAG: hypothetical protein JNM66_05610 [Bryobacterales bacterium]|nr:hypothetical protein [Bryobacterales bacterium]